MKKIAALTLILFCTLVVFSQSIGSKIDTLVSTYARLYEFNGSVLVANKGNVLLNKGYGYRNATDKILNDQNTIFQIGSVTKQFTSAVIQKLQGEKRLNVQDKLSKYFSGYPNGDSITIEHLLTHTSGIYNYTNDGEFMSNEITKPASREKMMALFKDKPLDFSPGSNWNYSNSGYILLGYIIEDVTGKSYYNAVRDYLFVPAKMFHSGFNFTNLESVNKAIGYLNLDNTTIETAPIVDSSVSFSAGSIFSTTGDLYRWHMALEGNSILSQAQKERAFSPVRNNYGYGWDIDSLEGKRRLSHGGGIPGFIVKISRIPEDDICIILLSNASDVKIDEMSKNIYSILYNKPYDLPKETPTIKIPEETLKQFVGVFEIQPGYNVTFIVRDGALVASLPGQKDIVMYSDKEDYFFDRKQDIKIEFTRNDKKEVTGFIFFQPGHGANLTCKKIK